LNNGLYFEEHWEHHKEHWSKVDLIFVGFLRVCFQFGFFGWWGIGFVQGFDGLIF
jgi:hypothetical protein